MTEDSSRDYSPSATTNSAVDLPASVPKKRIEDLLLDAPSPGTTFRELADQEAKSGKSVERSLRWPLVVLVLMIGAVVGVVVGWFQFGALLTGQSESQDQVRVEQRMAVPERPQPLAVAQQKSADTARDGVTGDGGVVAEIAQRGVTDVAVDEVAEVAVEVTIPVIEVVASPAVVFDAARNDIDEVILIAAEGIINEKQQGAAELPAAVVAEPVHRVLVGPFIGQGALERAAGLLRERGFEPHQQYGSGTVDMIRLLEGIYPLEQAQQRLEEVRKEFASAFLLPDGERWALYVGSFSDRERARRQQRELAERQIQVVPVDSQLTMEGPLLIVVRSGLQAAEEVAAEVNASGLRARIEIER